MDMQSQQNSTHPAGCGGSKQINPKLLLIFGGAALVLLLIIVLVGSFGGGGEDS